MGFKAFLQLPEYIPKEEILNKEVLDARIELVGAVRDWTYKPDGRFYMVVAHTENPDKTKPGPKNVLVPFSSIDKVGQFILLNAKIDVNKRRIKSSPR